QPVMYAKIKSHPSVATLYGESLVRQGLVKPGELEELWAEKKGAMHGGDDAEALPIQRPPLVVPSAVDASAMRGRLRTILKALGSAPQGFALHPKLPALVEERGGPPE